jgi:TPR repeat protein
MGVAYQTKGLGCDYHPAISLHYYAIASRAGDSDAYIGLSSWFVIGDEDVFEKNEKRAFDYAKNAADLGNPRGYFALAYYYEVGIYVKEDPEEARKYYMKARFHFPLHFFRFISDVY